MTNLAILQNGTNADLAATNIGAAFLPGSPELFSYEADGNLTNDGRWAYSWDAENRLIRVVSRSDTPSASRLSLTFGYDSQSRRISKVVSNWNGSAWSLLSDLRFVYDGWNLLATLNSQLSPLNCFAWGLDLSGTRQGAVGLEDCRNPVWPIPALPDTTGGIGCLSAKSRDVPESSRPISGGSGSVG